MSKTRNIKSLRTGEQKEIEHGKRKNVKPLTTREIDFVSRCCYNRFNRLTARRYNLEKEGTNDKHTRS